MKTKTLKKKKKKKKKGKKKKKKEGGNIMEGNITETNLKGNKII